MHGCNGRMGQMIAGLLREDAEAEIVAGVDTFDGVSNTFPVFAAIGDCDVEADVVIDFSNAGAVDGLLTTVRRKSCRWFCAPRGFLRNSFRRQRRRPRRRQFSNLPICLWELICF